MYWRWFGLILLLVSLIIGGIIVSGVNTFYRVESLAKEGVVNVPPWNSTEGWVGFNITLPNKEKINYEAYGLILPDDDDLNPKMVMRVVNETGLKLLKFGQFDQPTWDCTKVYAAAYLDENNLHSYFKFWVVDNSSEYHFLFRGLKNETQPRPILVNLKEAWSEGKVLLEPVAPNVLIVAITTIVGLSITITSSLKTRGRRLRKRRRMHAYMYNLWRTHSVRVYYF